MLLDELFTFIGRYVSFPSVEHQVATALWVFHAHCTDAAESTPRLAILSPEPGSGKTRLLEMIGQLVPNAIQATNISAAALFRSIEKVRPTLLLDEADSYLGPQTAKQHEDIRALINAGHRRGAETLRCVGEGAKMDVKRFAAYCAVAMAGLGNLPDTIMDRSIVLSMRRRRPDETLEPFRARVVEPVARALRDRLAAWSSSNVLRLSELIPVMPLGVTDRPADVWEPLIAIADAAGSTWAERARAACTAIVNTAADRGTSRGVQLLCDIRVIFDRDRRDAIPTNDVIRLLCEQEDSQWSEIRGAPITAVYLAKLLKPYGILPQQVRQGSSNIRCYRSSDCVDAWTRYLPEGATPATPATPSTSTASADFDAGLIGESE